jgi:hypothetical protein
MATFGQSEHVRRPLNYYSELVVVLTVGQAGPVSGRTDLYEEDRS